MTMKWNKPIKRQFWLGYFGGCFVMGVVIMIADPPRMPFFFVLLRDIGCAVICGMLTARYRPVLFKKPDNESE